MIIIKISILYSAYGDYQFKRSMKGAVVCEHCRTSRPFTGYNHRSGSRGVEGVALRWTSTAEEISDIAVAWGSVFGLAKGDLENRGDVADPIFQSGGGALQARYTAARSWKRIRSDRL
jgi:hypothetical protein